MKISELTTGQGNVDVEGTIKEVGEPKTFSRYGKDLQVSNAVLEDDSGNIKLTLWNEDATRFNAGEAVKVTNGYVNEFQGESQLTAGKFGKIEKVGESEAGSAATEAPEQAKLSDDAAESIGEDVAEDAAVQEAVKEEAPEGTSEEKVEEASEELEEAEEAPVEEAEEETEKKEE